MAHTSLQLRPGLAQAAIAWTVSVGTMMSEAYAETPAQVLASPPPHPVSAWIAVPIALLSVLGLIWALSKLIHRNYWSEKQFHSEEGDRAVTPVPDSDIHHLIH